MSGVGGARRRIRWRQRLRRYALDLFPTVRPNYDAAKGRLHAQPAVGFVGAERCGQLFAVMIGVIVVGPIIMWALMQIANKR